MIYIVMGVSGSGKTLIGNMLADQLNIPFYDADEFHPAENIEKMKSGVPLNDDDRRPWLLTLTQQMPEWQQMHGGAVLACSALKESYRRLLSSASVPIQYIFLKGSKELIASRMNKRSGHFMPQQLLHSQFEALEEPSDAVTISIDRSPDKIVQEILRQLNTENDDN